MLASEPVGGYLGRPSFFAEFNPLNSTLQKYITYLHTIEQVILLQIIQSWAGVEYGEKLNLSCVFLTAVEIKQLNPSVAYESFSSLILFGLSQNVRYVTFHKWVQAYNEIRVWYNTAYLPMKLFSISKLLKTYPPPCSLLPCCLLPPLVPCCQKHFPIPTTSSTDVVNTDGQADFIVQRCNNPNGCFAHKIVFQDGSGWSLIYCMSIVSVVPTSALVFGSFWQFGLSCIASDDKQRTCSSNTPFYNVRILLCVHL